MLRSGGYGSDVQPSAPSPYPGPPAGYPGPYGSGPYGRGPYGPQPYGGYGPAYRPGPRLGLPRPTAVAPVPGTAFGVALVEVRATTSGPAVGSLVTGIFSIVLALVVLLFDAAWGAAVAGAFALLTLLVGAAGVALGLVALRYIRRSVAWGPARGRGVAIAGLACAAVGLVSTVMIMLVALAMTASG